MTQISEESSISYPTPWHRINEILAVDVRQLSEDTYQLKSTSHSLTINQEGFELYRDGSESGMVVFEDWLFRNNIRPVPVERETDGES